jgi:hypothetical protein
VRRQLEHATSQFASTAELLDLKSKQLESTKTELEAVCNHHRRRRRRHHHHHHYH